MIFRLGYIPGALYSGCDEIAPDIGKRLLMKESRFIERGVRHQLAPANADKKFEKVSLQDGRVRFSRYFRKNAMGSSERCVIPLQSRQRLK